MIRLSKIAGPLAVMLALGGLASLCHADDTAYFTAGPLALNIPFKSAQVTYLFDFHQRQNLVGGETPFVTLWNRVEGTVGAVTSLAGQGTPFVGGDIIIGNVLDQWITLPSDLKIGGFGGWDFNAKNSIYGLKASYKLW